MICGAKFKIRFQLLNSLEAKQILSAMDLISQEEKYIKQKWRDVRSSMYK